jgi:two-component system sensor histidine kinase HydH
MKKSPLKKLHKKTWVGIPPWIILGSAVILSLIFIYWTLENINKQKENMSLLLLEKGAALIRSFEAGARTGMMGMMEGEGGGFRLQALLTQTAQQPDIVYLIVTDKNGKILAHNDPTKIGGTYGSGLDLENLLRTGKLESRQVRNPGGTDTFEVFRRFSPTQPPYRRRHNRMMSGMRHPSPMESEDQALNPDEIIFVGLDMGPIDEARKEDTRHTVIMAIILLLSGFAAIFSLFLAQAYRSTKTSLTRIKAFSDNLVENMPIGLMAVDSDGTIASFNQTAEAVLHLPADEVLGRKANEVLPVQLWNLMDQLETENGVIEKELECPVADGKMIPLDVSVSLLEGDDSTFLGHIILFRDMTEVQNLKREVETTQRLASLGRLAAGIAHEIRNPLSSIKGFATYFRDRYRENPEDQKTAQIMVQEVERLNRVIGELLEFARPVAVKPKPTSMNRLIQHSLRMIEGQARENNIKINTSLSPDLKYFPLDQDRINQVLLNLYLNAMEAMGKGGTLSVSLSRDFETGGIIISISDTGKGIDKKDMDHIFDPYFTTKQSGTGLGLAIVHKIVSSHKGEVKVTSSPGRGTTVMIVLPPTDRSDTAWEKIDGSHTVGGRKAM